MTGVIHAEGRRGPTRPVVSAVRTRGSWGWRVAVIWRRELLNVGNGWFAVSGARRRSYIARAETMAWVGLLPVGDPDRHPRRVHAHLRSRVGCEREGVDDPARFEAVAAPHARLSSQTGSVCSITFGATALTSGRTDDGAGRSPCMHFRSGARRGPGPLSCPCAALEVPGSGQGARGVFPHGMAGSFNCLAHAGHPRQQVLRKGDIAACCPLTPPQKLCHWKVESNIPDPSPSAHHPESHSPGDRAG